MPYSDFKTQHWNKITGPAPFQKNISCTHQRKTKTHKHTSILIYVYIYITSEQVVSLFPFGAALCCLLLAHGCELVPYKAPPSPTFIAPEVVPSGLNWPFCCTEPPKWWFLNGKSHLNGWWLGVPKYFRTPPNWIKPLLNHIAWLTFGLGTTRHNWSWVSRLWSLCGF